MRLTIIAGLLAVGLAAVPITQAGAADPIATTTGLTVSAPTTVHDVELQAEVRVPDGQPLPLPLGIVVFSVDGVERARAVLLENRTFTVARAYLEADDLAGAVFTAEYLGSTTHAPSAGSQTVTRSLDPGSSVTGTGTLTLGPTVFEANPRSARPSR